MIVLYNPHVDDFLAEPPHFRFLKRRPLKKYGFFIDESLRNGQEVNVLIDGTCSAFIPEKIFHQLPKFLRHLISDLEYQRWLKINQFGSLVKRVEAPQEKSDQVLLAFSYKAATGNFSLRHAVLSRYKAVVFHLSHYFILTKEKSDHIKTLDNAWLAGDSDVTEVDYFKKFFSWYRKEFLVLSFAIAPRFNARKNFFKRQNKCVATGSFHDLTQELPAEKYSAFMETTQSSTYHPIRKKIYEQAPLHSNLIDCQVSPYRQYGSASKLKRALNHFLVKQKKYFSIDLVDLYNDYRFAVVGEELAGFPALGAFEAMACGCVLIGDPRYYKGLGLLADKHFIPYDETLENLLQTIAKKKAGVTNHIADTSLDFVRGHFNSAAVYERWQKSLLCLMV